MKTTQTIVAKLPCYEIGDTFEYQDSLHEEFLTENEVRNLGMRVFDLYEDEEENFDSYLSTHYSYSA